MKLRSSLRISKTSIFASEDAQRTAPDESTQPVSDRPFPFLKLPREIRDIIYYYALLLTGKGLKTESTWEQMTRLYLVNHQVYLEATKTFYSSITFFFGMSSEMALDHDMLRNPSNARARSFVRRIQTMVFVGSDAGCNVPCGQTASNRLRFAPVNAESTQ